MTSNADQRTRLVASLWRLKSLLSQHEGMYVHFNMLLNDPGYRKAILDSSLDSKTTQISETAAQALALNMDGRLVISAASTGEPGEGHWSNQAVDTLAMAAGTPAEVGQTKGAAKKAASTANPGMVLTLVLGLAGLFFAGIGYWFFAEKRVMVAGSIFQSTVWSNKNVYVLTDTVFVEPGARLTIEPGTKILGQPGSALVVTRDAYIYARGTLNAPIVFTSAKPEGQRIRGDWGGVVLLGNAPVNQPSAHIEGISDNDARGYFGGNDPSWNCGILEYVRIEFAGFEVYKNNELNGLMLGGCGNRTVVRYVQSHMANDDGIEVFGGTVDLSNIVISRAADDSLDWDMGWRGRVQYLVVQQDGEAGDNGFEADNAPIEFRESGFDAKPRSLPTIYNATLVGSRGQGNPDIKQRAMTIRRGTGGIMRNFIITGFPTESIDLRDKATVDLLATGELQFSNMIIYNPNASLDDYFANEALGSKQDDDGGFQEADYFTAIERNIRFVPILTEAAFSLTEPNFAPRTNSAASYGAADIPEGEFWDEGATYLGALRPGTNNSWLQGWTAFPVD